MKLFCFIAAGLLGASASAALAQSAAPFPTRPVTLVVPFAPGGASDGMGRLFAQGLTEIWKVPVIVENRPGASGTIGGEFVRRAAPDGHTLLLAGPATLTILAAVNPRIPYDPVKDFAPVSVAVSYPYVLTANTSVAKTLPDLLAHLKQQPGKLTYASSGVGTTTHFMAELFKAMAGVDMMNVPYQGVGPGMNAVMANHVSMLFAPVNEVGPALQSGKLTALGVTSAQRIPELPDVPAITEFVKGYTADSWISVLAPASTPPVLLERMSNDLRSALTLPDIARKLKEMGLTQVLNRPGEARDAIEADAATWRTLAKQMNIKAQ
ncbi:Bug family tripartite tricarboxylate transporter substrate binding protein [Pigmentiphaga litoralis]|uniref:Bug family tripartite tricarboxylate transporter substrate binding protein n=1 Tax=Pigmentiphaga litoralis TaxID=516702 RepID=UPI003B431985